jgi:hypothetical protein
MNMQTNIPTSLPIQSPAVDPRLLEWIRQLVQAARQAQMPDMPTLPGLLDQIANMPILQSVGLLILGIVFLVWGGRFFKLLMMLNAAVIGAVAGGALAVQIGQDAYWWQFMLGGAVVIGLLAWPLMKLTVGLLAMGYGAVLGYAVYETVAVAMERTDLLAHSWSGAIAGALVLGLIGFLLLPVGVRILMALQGACMFAAGLLGLLFQNPDMHEYITESLMAKPPLLMIGVTGVFFVGLALQLATMRKHLKDKNQPETAKNN